MNLIVQDFNNIVWLQTDGNITQSNGVYVVDGISVGIPISENSVIQNALPLTYQEFFPQTYTYVDGVWGIGNQDFYDVCYNQLVQETGLPIKEKRDALLYASDWTQIPNNPLTLEQQQAWATYRQALRNITLQSGYPFNVVFPTPPTLFSSIQPVSSGLQQL
jgi:hypothetical protein